MVRTSRPATADAPLGAHARGVGEFVAALGSDRDHGLSEAEAALRLARHGPNELPEAPRRSSLQVFVDQFRSPLIYLLLAAAGTALLLGQRGDAAVIAAVVGLNALIGAFQEGRAERSLQALRKLTRQRARVLRGGTERGIEARELVPGDVLLLESGDAVPADARLLELNALRLTEAALTGESVPVAKELLPLEPDTPLADRTNIVFAGTHVASGRARALVVATGADMEIGSIARLAESAEDRRTPLERRVAQFGRSVILAAALLFVVILAVGFARGLPAGQLVMVGISQVVGIIPEGLPVAITIALAVGVQRMARRGTIVRKLPAVETLGSVTVICSDKTGTLTRNELTVTNIELADGGAFTVTGTGYAPDGKILEHGRDLAPARAADLRALLEAAVLCSDAQLDAPRAPEADWRALGDPTEIALLSLAIKGGLSPRELRSADPRRAEIPFDPAVKLMASQHGFGPGARVIVKGAPELLLGLCGSVLTTEAEFALDEERRRALDATVERMAGQALRVLAIGVARGVEIDERAGFEALAGRVALLGLVGQIDPPRAEVRAAVDACRQAGIRVVMVTGDHKATGHAIARTLEVAREGTTAIDARELERLSPAELAGRLDEIAVFARVHPAQKLRIVEAYQLRGEVVAMTGDGANDAPALAQADVGIAMGIAGTDVAREAADVVIGDDNFATIVAAVEEGRVIYRNLKKTLLLLFSTSAAEVLVLVLSLVLGLPLPFAAVQILWNNLVTEGLVTVNLILEPAEGDEMRRAPVAADEPLLTRALLTRMGFMVPAIVISTLGWFGARIAAGVPEAQARTETFTLLAICEWFNVLNCRSERNTALDLGLLRNPWLLAGLLLGNLLQVAVLYWEPMNRVFHTVPIPLDVVVALAAVGSLVLWIEELRKLLARRREAQAARTPLPGG